MLCQLIEVIALLRLLAELWTPVVSEELLPFVTSQLSPIEFAVAAALNQSIEQLQTADLLKASIAEMQLVMWRQSTEELAVGSAAEAAVAVAVVAQPC